MHAIHFRALTQSPPLSLNVSLPLFIRTDSTFHHQMQKHSLLFYGFYHLRKDKQPGLRGDLSCQWRTRGCNSNEMSNRNITAAQQAVSKPGQAPLSFCFVLFFQPPLQPGSSCSPLWPYKIFCTITMETLKQQALSSCWPWHTESYIHKYEH